RQAPAKPTIPGEVQRILAKKILRPKREKLSGVRGEVALPSSKSSETWASFKPRGLEMEQLPPLSVSGDCDCRDRIGVDSARPGTEGALEECLGFSFAQVRAQNRRDPGAPCTIDRRQSL